MATLKTLNFPRQRVHASRLELEMVLSDYDPQVGGGACQLDPICAAYSNGFVFDVRL